MKKLLFITWSISYGYGTEKSLADVLNRMDKAQYDISILPLFKNSDSTIFDSNIEILDSLIDYTEKNFDEHVIIMHHRILLLILRAEQKFFGLEEICVNLITPFSMKTQVNISRSDRSMKCRVMF